MPDDVLKRLGSRMQAARKDCGLTQDELSAASGVSVRHIAKIEKGVMNPSFEILSNTKDIQAVRNSKLGITQIVFHKAGTISGITVDKPMMVMVREKEKSVEVTVSDPTQKLNSATVKLDRSLGDIINKDLKLTAEGEGNTIIKADFEKSKGRSMMISFVK